MKKLVCIFSVCLYSALAHAQPKLILHLDFNTVQWTKDAVISLLREASGLGYDAVLWEVEDKVAWDVPGIAAADAFSKAEFREILAEADRLGLEPIPLFQTFGHGEYVLKKDAYRKLRENADEPDCYCVSNPETAAFQKRMLDEYLELFGSRVKWFHLGADEAYGFAKCPVCSKRDKMELYVEHLNRMSAVLESRGIRPCVWHDLVAGGWWQQGAAVDASKVPRKYLVWLWDYGVGASPKGPTAADSLGKLLDLGFDVVIAGASSSYRDGPFVSGTALHRPNLAACAEMARTRDLAGFAVTSWSIRQNLRATQRPLFRFAAKRLRNPSASVEADWLEALSGEKGLGIAADVLDRATQWEGELTRLDGRACSRYKDGTIPGARDFVKRLAESRAKGLVPSEDFKRSIAAALDEGVARSSGVWKEAFELERATLAAIDSALQGRPVEPLDEAAAVRHLAREQSPLSATNSARIIWGYFPRVRADDGVVDWESIPWLGDGRPERDGADWYAPDPAPVFTASVVLPKGGARKGAKFEVACPGCYVLAVNGNGPRGGSFPVFPQWSAYDTRVYAETFDFDLQEGTNVVTLFLGNGWYNMPPLRFWGTKCFREALAHGRPCFKMRLDGAALANWTWRETPYVQNSYQLGEIVDGTYACDLTARPAVAVAGPKGAVEPRRAPPIAPLLAQGVYAESFTTLSNGAQVVDFGMNLTRLPFYRLRGLSRGDRVEFIYGERLNADGSVNALTQAAGQIKRKGMGGPGAPDVAVQRDVCVSDGEDRPYMPFLTWHVFRYVEIRGLKQPLKLGDVSGMPIGSAVKDTPRARDFNPRRPEFLKLHETCVRTFLANLMSVQSDCPGRERLGYGGDIVATCEALIANFDMCEFYLKTLQDFADEAAGDGWITETAPYVGIADSRGISRSGGGRAGPISWSLVVPVLMDAIIRHYPEAKARALAFYPTCARYVRLMDAANPEGYVADCIGDHEALERAPDDVTATAHWHEFVRLTASFARLLGKKDDAEALDSLERKIRTAFVTRFVKDGLVANGTQSAQAIGLYLGLVPSDQVAAAEAQLVRAIEAKGCGPTTGIFSTRYMLIYLSEHGRRDLAEKIVLHKGFPGWLHMLDRGATTLWETWKESDNVYSNCHPMFGSVDEWLLKYGSSTPSHRSN